ncbi:hypothetical protein Tco_1252370 [Tanacetum coccineum]
MRKAQQNQKCRKRGITSMGSDWAKLLCSIGLFREQFAGVGDSTGVTPFTLDLRVRTTRVFQKYATAIHYAALITCVFNVSGVDYLIENISRVSWSFEDEGLNQSQCGGFFMGVSRDPVCSFAHGLNHIKRNEVKGQRTFASYDVFGLFWKSKENQFPVLSASGPGYTNVSMLFGRSESAFPKVVGLLDTPEKNKTKLRRLLRDCACASKDHLAL